MTWRWRGLAGCWLDNSLSLSLSGGGANAQQINIIADSFVLEDIRHDTMHWHCLSFPLQLLSHCHCLPISSLECDGLSPSASHSATQPARKPTMKVASTNKYIYRGNIREREGGLWPGLVSWRLNVQNILLCQLHFYSITTLLAGLERSNVKNSQRVTLSGVLEYIVPHFHHHHPFDSVEHDHLLRLFGTISSRSGRALGLLPLDWGLAKAQISQSGIDTGASCLMNKQQQHVVVCGVMIPLGECWPLLLYQFSFRHWISKCAPIWWPNK